MGVRRLIVLASHRRIAPVALAVHHWHLAIHHDDVERLPFDSLYRGNPVLGNDDLEADRGHEPRS